MQVNDALKYLEAVSPEGYEVTVNANDEWALFEVWPPKSKKKRDEGEGEPVRVSHGISPVALGNMDVGTQDFSRFIAQFFPWGAANDEAIEKATKKIDRAHRKEESATKAEATPDVDSAVSTEVAKANTIPASQLHPNTSDRVEDEHSKASELGKTTQVKPQSSDTKDSNAGVKPTDIPSRRTQESAREAIPSLHADSTDTQPKPFGSENKSVNVGGDKKSEPVTLGKSNAEADKNK